MRKTFLLTQRGKTDARVLDAIKHEVRKYVKRERRKPMPPGYDTWAFECKVGLDEASAESRALGEVSAAIDAAAGSGTKALYVEILAVPARRASQSQTGAGATLPTGSVPPADTA